MAKVVKSGPVRNSEISLPLRSLITFSSLRERETVEYYKSLIAEKIFEFFAWLLIAFIALPFMYVLILMW